MSEIETADELQRRKFEEALEVKSLRRIISAYLKYTHTHSSIPHPTKSKGYPLGIIHSDYLSDFMYSYPEAAGEDVKRWERSLTKLPPPHKVFVVPDRYFVA